MSEIDDLKAAVAVLTEERDLLRGEVEGLRTALPELARQRDRIGVLTEERDAAREALVMRPSYNALVDRVAVLEAGLRDAVWQFNEAVSLLREARTYLLPSTGLAEDIDEGIDAMQAALEATALLGGTEPAAAPEPCPTSYCDGCVCDLEPGHDGEHEAVHADTGNRHRWTGSAWHGGETPE